MYFLGRPVKCVFVSPVQTHFLLVAYGPVKEQGKPTSKVSLVVMVLKLRNPKYSRLHFWSKRYTNIQINVRREVDNL